MLAYGFVVFVVESKEAEKSGRVLVKALCNSPQGDGRFYASSHIYHQTSNRKSIFLSSAPYARKTFDPLAAKDEHAPIRYGLRLAISALLGLSFTPSTTVSVLLLE